MSLYNMLFGMNDKSDLLLAVIGFKRTDVERFRDVHVEDDGATIAVYTRTGGGNRPDYPQAALCRSPLFRATEDDDFDSTYATFYFDVPASFVKDVAALSNPLCNGIRKAFGLHLLKTLGREPTEGDKAQAAHDTERDRLSRTRHFKANGHTFVPLDDLAMKTALELAEANSGELHSAWGILPIKVTVKTDEVRELRNLQAGTTYADWNRAELGYSFKWEIDEPYWAHCQKRFSADYPETMRKIAAQVETYRSKNAA